MSGITGRDFQPINSWKVLEKGPTYRSGKPRYIQDQSTGKLYFNESKTVIAIKGALLTLGTPIVHTVGTIVNVAVRLFNIISGAHFRNANSKLSFSAKMGNLGKDLARVVLFPLSLVGLQLAVVYTMINPLDGRKLYASFERATYGSFLLAPCFQPDPNTHFFGGNIDQENAF